VASIGEGPVALEEYRAWQFPGTGPGGENGSAVLSHLRALEASGAEFLVIPRTAFDWLERHPEIADRLKSRHRFVTRQEHVCEIYELCAPVAEAEQLSQTKRSEDAGRSPAGAEPSLRRSRLARFFRSLFRIDRNRSAD
jgi:hypothetical protein